MQAQVNDTRENESGARVVGGTTVDVGEFPWMVSLAMSDGNPGCGASLIDSMWVLTAAHCITDDLPFPGVPTIDNVIINSIVNDAGILEPFSELIEVENIHVHEDYAGIIAGGTGPDIALIRLSIPATTTPVALAEVADSLDYAHNMPAKVLGWGKTEAGGDNVDTLRMADCFFITSDTCATLYEASSFDPSPYDANAGGNICAGFFTGTLPAGAAQGDSGGPLFYETLSGEYKQVGIVSGGNSDITTEDFPGIFTLVPKYQEWIDSIMSTYELPTSVNLDIIQDLSVAYFANKSFLIDGLKPEYSYNFSLFDLSGRLVKSEQVINGAIQHNLSVIDLHAGIHVLKIDNLDNGKIYTQKFLIK